MFIDQTVTSFSFKNAEQERAFRIIANHASTPQCEQLNMYLGGMGGTGKSQVIKALMSFFKHRNESHRFVVLAPTGTAAALLGGSTYHSFLGIRSGNTSAKNESVTISQLRGRVEGVDYIFLDELSMLSCHDMYKISSQLAKAMNVTHMPFGGLNMIFSGDFAQLPPVGGASLYSGGVGTQPDSGLRPHLQESAIGKALWHQVTTVVILRENMRQKTQTPEDKALRTALVNMRYGACTPEDIKFLRSRIAGMQPGQPKVSSKYFRNVAIICGIHTQKDMINQLGCQRFADETGQKLTNFYSIDRWAQDSDQVNRRKGKAKSSSRLRHTSNEINFDDQLEIWKVHPGATEHFPGKLSLCIGMPIMIRNNDATELCITKGQEGFVAGWQSTVGPHGKQVLDTLFIRLDNPPLTVNISGLPENVVPIVKSKKTIQCTFPSDLRESIERQQVWALPNFAMTAHASQGKTRPYNVVHLNSCSNHMAYYTALSCSASAGGTIIIQGFDPRVITKGCSGYLRQEFRELELLDEITRLRYEERLPEHSQGSTRSAILQLFQQWKGADYVPAKMDGLLRWSAKDPLVLDSAINSPWQIIDKHKGSTGSPLRKDNTSYVPAKGSQTLKQQQMHAFDDVDDDSTSKKQKISASSSAINNIEGPTGLIWDGDNYSCAYDSLLVILYHIWTKDPKAWSRHFRNFGNHYLTALDRGFKQHLEGSVSLEKVRDDIRFAHHSADPIAYPTGPRGASVGRLAFDMLKINDVVASSQIVCSNCTYKEPEQEHILGYVISPAESTQSSQSTSQWINNLGHDVAKSCPECMCEMNKIICHNEPPKLLMLEYPESSIETNPRIKYDTDGGDVYLNLKGIVYLGSFHFTSRLIESDGTIWYHDGRTTGALCEPDGNVGLMSNGQLRSCRGRALVMAVYAQD